VAEGPEPVPFATPEDLRAWLEAHHETATELWVLRHKKGSGRPTVTWPQIVDECLCFGWIDGQIKSIDEWSLRQRITPRKPGSTWSARNVERVAALTAAGRMRPAGLAAWEARREDRTAVYTYERDQPRLSAQDERRFRAEAEAWAFFGRQIPSYRRTAIGWVTGAKRQATRERRLAELIECSGRGVAPAPYRWAELKP
jgi:uncharacterized protein YdeI (YjbR/CyaY-like superfamily)